MHTIYLYNSQNLQKFSLKGKKNIIWQRKKGLLPPIFFNSLLVMAIYTSRTKYTILTRHNTIFRSPCHPKSKKHTWSCLVFKSKTLFCQHEPQLDFASVVRSIRGPCLAKDVWSILSDWVSMNKQDWPIWTR